MQDKTYTTIDKSHWPRGEWDNEPDKMQFTDQDTGSPCLIVRVDWSGHLCGYVGVSKGHPTYGMDLSQYKQGQPIYPDVHGGITFGDFCQDTDDECKGICHQVEDGEDDKVWWHGFDCAHLDDYCPGMISSIRFSSDRGYRNVEYVKDQCRQLAMQLFKLDAGIK